MTALRSAGVPGLAALAWRAVADRYERHARTMRAMTRRAMEFGVQPHLLRPRVRHVYGPDRVAYGPDELLVICVVRNGAVYVRSFLEHYQRLGAAHCVFLDNGSTDDTVARLCRHDRVTVLQADVPYERYENTMKRYLADRFSAGRWHLCADIDELFDYPCSDELPLRSFLRYLEARGFTALVAQMLDMFADGPLAALESSPDDRVREKYVHYDISDIDRRPYEWSGNTNPHVRMHWGGIRRLVFGTSNGLTKAPLVKLDGRTRPFIEWHQVTGAVVADVTGVLLHYPFVSAFHAKVQDAVRTGRYGATTTGEYVAYARALARDPALSLKRPTARRFAGLEPLVDDGFVVVSPEYEDWVRRHAARPGA